MSDELKPIRTVGDLVAVLQRRDPATPVGCLTYHPERCVVGVVGVVLLKLRAAHPGADLPGGTPYWFELGSEPAIYHEERGGALETVVVVAQGV